MRRSFLLLFSLVSLFSFSQDAGKLHKRAVLVDGHNDVLSSGVLDGLDISHRLKEGHSDLPRWKEGGVDVQFFSVWTDKKPRNKGGFFMDALEEIDSLNHLVLRNAGSMTLARTYRQVKNGIRQNKLVALIGVEGGHMMENDISNLDKLYTLGMRYLTLTWNNSTEWATSAMDETLKKDSLKHIGLTDFGRSVIRRMNRLGVIVDLSHVGEKTFYDALSVTTKPVMLSHSSVWSICPVFRNVKDEQIKAVAENNGVICINFYSGFISKEFDRMQDHLTRLVRDSMQRVLLAANNGDSSKMRSEWRTYYRAELEKVRPTLAQLVDHIDYIVKLVGENYVGIGSDYDGVGSLPVGLEDVTTYPRITEELLKRGYSRSAIKKILGGNVLRVMKDNFENKVKL